MVVTQAGVQDDVDQRPPGDVGERLTEGLTVVGHDHDAVGPLAHAGDLSQGLQHPVHPFQRAQRLGAHRSRMVGDLVAVEVVDRHGRGPARHLLRDERGVQIL